MAITINIGNIEAVHFVPPLDGAAQSLHDQVIAGVSPETLRDIGYQDTPDADVAAHMQEEEQYEQAAINATERRSFLRNVSMHADRARGMEGFSTNHQRHPRVPKQVSAKQHRELVMADESLERACAACALRPNCTITGLDNWLDFHPYKAGPKGNRRPGSVLLPRQVETRTAFLKALAKDPLAHCDLSKRQTPAEQ